MLRFCHHSSVSPSFSQWSVQSRPSVRPSVNPSPVRLKVQPVQRPVCAVSQSRLSVRTSVRPPSGPSRTSVRPGVSSVVRSRSHGAAYGRLFAAARRCTRVGATMEVPVTMGWGTASVYGGDRRRGCHDLVASVRMLDGWAL